MPSLVARAVKREAESGQGAGAMMPLGKAPGAQFEISVDGKPRSYRDRKAIAMEAAEYLKWKHPHSEVVVKDLASWKETAVPYNISRRRRGDLAARGTARVLVGL